LLGTTDLNEAQLFNIKIPYDQSGKVLPSGQGFYIKRKLTKVKVAHAFANGADQLSQQISEVKHSYFVSN
jgi:S-DNA-T family DNA segregation ATPase FtsK/SpoIIIE